jgi:hypothetical protein
VREMDSAHMVVMATVGDGCVRRVPYHLVHLENTTLSDSPSPVGHINIAP